MIKDVCDPNAFPYITDLAKGAKFPNDGRWMFGQDERVVSAKQFKSQMHAMLVDELAKSEGLNRSQRRQLGRKASMTELIRKQIQLSLHFGLLPKFEWLLLPEWS
ncbi:hypothetical protein [Tritonibacter mobilis]|uniref:Uncharacterized protein n=1 Tax=Tritonibacter mobilis F1926 TaxID=1265309 RepID=A0A1B1A794_9RHOB|nr:hypothetical protein [Tritonibacter mobilis]ANP42442.1 hypothetical protein K529_016860 [Tritonibacter mobilis F1926]KJZ21542.1 hypothetical protein TW79_22235 [Tritonibacter mobilis]